MKNSTGIIFSQQSENLNYKKEIELNFIYKKAFNFQKTRRNDF